MCKSIVTGLWYMVVLNGLRKLQKQEAEINVSSQIWICRCSSLPQIRLKLSLHASSAGVPTVPIAPCAEKGEVSRPDVFLWRKNLDMFFYVITGRHFLFLSADTKKKQASNLYVIVSKSKSALYNDGLPFVF